MFKYFEIEVNGVKLNFNNNNNSNILVIILCKLLGQF